MRRLPEIIGPAPSEMPLEELVAKLRLERDRVRVGLKAFVEAPAKKQRTTAKAKKKGWTQKKMQAMLDEYGLTAEEFQKLLENGDIKL